MATLNSSPQQLQKKEQIKKKLSTEYRNDKCNINNNLTSMINANRYIYIYMECHYFNFASNIQNAPKAPISAITSSMPKVATRQDYNFVPYARK